MCTFLPWLWTLFYLGSGWRLFSCQTRGCTVSPCRTVLCHCVGRDWAGGQAKGRKVSLKKKKRPCVRIHHHPTYANAKHFFLHSTSNQNVWKHCRSSSLSYNSKTTSMSIFLAVIYTVRLDRISDLWWSSPCLWSKSGLRGRADP